MILIIILIIIMIMIVISFVTSLHWLRIVKFQGGYLEIMHMIIEFKEVVSLGISDLSKRYHSLIWDIIIYYLLSIIYYYLLEKLVSIPVVVKVAVVRWIFSFKCFRPFIPRKRTSFINSCSIHEVIRSQYSNTKLLGFGLGL